MIPSIATTHVLIVSNDSKSLLDFRWGLIQSLRQQQTTVSIVCNQDASFDALQQAAKQDQVQLIPYPIRNSGLNPLTDLKFLIWLRRLYTTHAITHALLYRVKPVIYGSLAALGTSVKPIATITGLGYVYTQKTAKTTILRFITNQLYRLSLARSHWIFFQNKDDQEFFLNQNLVNTAKTSVVGGSGVDLDTFSVTPLPKTLSFLMAARLLRDKGVLEYLEAAAALKEKYPHVIFKLAGGKSDNPAALKVEDIQEFCKNHNLMYMGQVKDMPQALQASSIFVLPSYREGMPRAGLEALSCARPIITTDTQGCRDLIAHNGFMVPVQDTETLKQAMEQMILLDRPKLEEFAQNSRRLAETVYDVRFVNQQILSKLQIFS